VQLRRLLLFCRNILWFDNTKYCADCNKDFWRNDYWSPVEKCAGKRRTIDADFMHPFSIRSCRLAGSPDWFRYWSIYVRGCPGLPSRPLARPSDFHLLKQRLAALVAICHRRTETETERAPSERKSRCEHNPWFVCYGIDPAPSVTVCRTFVPPSLPDTSPWKLHTHTYFISASQSTHKYAHIRTIKRTMVLWLN